MRLLYSFLMGLLLAVPGWAQERVRNVRFRAVDSSKIEIRYDLLNTRAGDSIYFDARSRLRGTLRILPEFVQGDVGRDIVAGSDHRIVWDALANGYSLNEEIQVIIRVRVGQPVRNSAPTLATKPESKPTESTLTKPVITRSEPPASKPAATPPKRTTTTPATPKPTESVATTEPARPAPTQPAPVTETPTRPRQDPPVTVTQPAPRSEPATTAPPVAETPTPIETPASVRRGYNGPAWALVSAVAPGIGNIFVQRPRPKVGLRPLLTVGTYGLAVYGMLQKQKANEVFAVYEQQKNAATAEPFYQIANRHNHRYYAATRTAITVAAADMVLTFFKGLRNSQLRKEARLQNVSIRPNIQAGHPTAYVQISF